MKLIKRILLLLNYIAVFLLCLGYAAPYVDPSQFWPIAFVGLALPYVILVNVFFVLLWAARGNGKLFISLIVIALGYKSVPNLIQLDFKNEEVPEETHSIMSFNVRVFDLYLWTKEKTTRNQIFAFLEEEDPDILCLQEFYHAEQQDSNYNFKTLDTLVQFLSAKNYHFHITTTNKEFYHFGLITFSKYPILNKGIVPFEGLSDNASIYTDLKIDDDTVRIYNNHLASIKLDKYDYKAVQKMRENKYGTNWENTQLLLQKIKGGFELRAGQAEAIRQHIDNSPYPVVVAGDFNDSPTSFAYQKIRGDLKDAFVESGSGIGHTYIGDFPSFRIDYILHDKALSSYNFSTHDVQLSDHHPISAKFSFNKN